MMVMNMSKMRIKVKKLNKMKRRSIIMKKKIMKENRRMKMKMKMIKTKTKRV